MQNKNGSLSISKNKNQFFGDKTGSFGEAARKLIASKTVKLTKNKT